LNALWRISNHNDLEGLGGERSDGRWHTASRGKRVVYLAEHPALALIEVLANLSANPKLFPERYQLLKITADGPVSTEVFAADTLTPGWRRNFSETRPGGNAWLAGGSSALLSVPSAPVPESLNYLLNPLHPDARALKVEWRKWIAYDPRLFHTREIVEK